MAKAVTAIKKIVKKVAGKKEVVKVTKKKVTCEACNGTGLLDAQNLCVMCDGSGQA